MRQTLEVIYKDYFTTDKDTFLMLHNGIDYDLLGDLIRNFQLKDNGYNLSFNQIGRNTNVHHKTAQKHYNAYTVARDLM